MARMTAGRSPRAVRAAGTTGGAGSLRESRDRPVKGGVMIEPGPRGGPAAAAGLHGGDRVALAGMRRIAIGGDVIVAIDGQKVSNQFDLNVILNRKRPGDTVNVTVYRGGKKMDTPVKIGERTGN